MKKSRFFRCFLLLSILLFSINASSKSFISKKDLSTIDVVSQVRKASPIVTYPMINRQDTLNALGTIISMEEEVESILEKIGHPNRIMETEMGFEYYVYNNNYSKLLFVAIRDNKVVGFYTDSIDFNYMGLTPESDIKDINRVLNTQHSMDYIINHRTDSYTLHIFIDEIGLKKITGILVLDVDLKYIAHTENTMKNTELLVYDLTNSMRKKNGISLLSWSSTAAKAARKHSVDMARQGFFNHKNIYGKSPGDRLREEGINYKNIGENIIAGYGGAIISTHAWYNTPEHRENILNNTYKSLGVGFTYLEDSNFKTYITQNFYR